MRKIFIYVVLILSITVFLLGCGEDAKQEVSEESPNTEGEIIATVNGEEIRMLEYERLMERAKDSYDQQGIDLESEEAKDKYKNLEQQILDNLINEKIIVQNAEKKGIIVSESEINKQFEDIQAQFKDDSEFDQALEANNLTIDILKETIKKEIITNQYIENEIGEITVSEDEIQQYYEQAKQQQEEIPDIDEIAVQIEQQLIQIKQQEKLTLLIEQLKENSEIEVLI